MNRFQNQILWAAGFAVLAGIASGITAAPAIAQAVKAALIKNVDERGRVPYSITLQCEVPTNSNGCTALSAAIPANRRFVGEHINGFFQRANAAAFAQVSLITRPNDFHRFAPVFVSNDAVFSDYALNEPFHAYVGAGDTLRLQVLLRAIPASGSGMSVTVTGYLVDLTI